MKNARDSKATSIRTRIETCLRRQTSNAAVLFKSNIHKNKDWNKNSAGGRKGLLKFKSNIHKNKDWNYKLAVDESISMPYSKATSIRTRIETKQYMKNVSANWQFKSNIHKNKDWNSLLRATSFSLAALFKSNIHKNKDWNWKNMRFTIK